MALNSKRSWELGDSQDDLERRLRDIDAGLLEELERDARLASGVPANQRATDLNFIEMTGLTRPAAHRFETGEEDALELHAELAASFFEEGVDDVDAGMAPGTIDAEEDEADFAAPRSPREQKEPGAATGEYPESTDEGETGPYMIGPEGFSVQDLDLFEAEDLLRELENQPHDYPSDMASAEETREEAADTVIPLDSPQAEGAAHEDLAGPYLKEEDTDLGESPELATFVDLERGTADDDEPHAVFEFDLCESPTQADTEGGGEAEAIEASADIDALLAERLPETDAAPRFDEPAAALPVEQNEEFAPWPQPGLVDDVRPWSDTEAGDVTMPAHTPAGEPDALIHRRANHLPGRPRSRRSRRRQLVRRVKLLIAAIVVLAIGYAFLHATVWFFGAPEDLLNEGARLIRAGDFRAASKAYARFLEANPGHPQVPEAQFSAAFCLQCVKGGSQEEYKRALALFEQFLNDNASHEKAPRARCLMGMLHFRLGHYSQAIDLLKDPELRLKDPAAALPALRALAQSYIQLGDYESAQLVLRQAAAIDGNLTPELDFAGLGDLYRKMAELAATPGDAGALQRQAVEQWERAMACPGIAPPARKDLKVKIDLLRLRLGETDDEASDYAAVAPAPVQGVPDYTSAPAILEKPEDGGATDEGAEN